MKKLFYLALVALCTMFANQSLAQNNTPAYNALLDKAVAIQYENLDMVGVLTPQFQTFVTEGIIKAEDLKPFTSEVIDIMMPPLKEEIKKIYRDNFTYSELQQVVNWESSPIAKKCKKLSGAFAEAGFKIGQDPDYISKVQEILVKYMSK